MYHLFGTLQMDHPTMHIVVSTTLQIWGPRTTIREDHQMQ